MSYADERLTIKAGEPAPADGHFYSDEALRAVFDTLADRRLKIRALEVELQVARDEAIWWEKKYDTMDKRISVIRAEIALATAKSPGFWKRHLGFSIGLTANYGTGGEIHGGLGVAYGWRF